MLRAFIDDTGNDPNSPVFSFAGWVASVKEWERFSDAWDKCLRSKPSIQYFKHHEARSRRTGQFEGWPAKECEKKMLSLTEVIVKSEIKYGLWTGVNNQMIRGLVKQSVPSLKVVRNILHYSRPYDWCFFSIVQMAFHVELAFEGKESVDFIFDQGDAAFEDCRSFYNEVKTILPPAYKKIAGSVSEEDDKVLMPLQAADLLAGASMSWLRGSPRSSDIYNLLQTNKPIFLAPVNRRRTPFPDADTEQAITMLNVPWATKMIEAAAKRKSG
jgi:hypothetical protein